MNNVNSPYHKLPIILPPPYAHDQHGRHIILCTCTCIVYTPGTCTCTYIDSGTCMYMYMYSVSVYIPVASVPLELAARSIASETTPPTPVDTAHSYDPIAAELKELIVKVL